MFVKTFSSSEIPIIWYFFLRKISLFIWNKRDIILQSHFINESSDDHDQHVYKIRRGFRKKKNLKSLYS